MGFYLRKSVSVGPFRFNLSGSGVGVSAGIPGFRIGSGPRGNYVHLGRGGLYYRQALPSSDRAPRAVTLVPSGTHAPLEEVESASAAQIVDSSSEQLLAEIREKRQKMRITPFAVVASLVLLFFVASRSQPGWLLLCCAMAGVLAIALARHRDRIEKTVVILYDFEPAVELALRRFVEWGQAVASSHRAWHVAASGHVYDRKYHAGASQLVQRHVTTLRTSPPPYVQTNVPVLALGAGRQTLYFLPDRLLVYDGAGIGAIAYGTLDLSVTSQRFIEEGGAPSDATVVGHTWRYVNRNGGPDRRFNNNPQLPVCLYDELHVRTASGLNEIFQLSKAGVGQGFASAVQFLAAHVTPGDAPSPSL